MSDIVIVSTDALIGVRGKQGEQGLPGATQSLWYINDMAQPYFGFTDANGTWLIRKLDDVAGTVRYASEQNNPAMTTYSSAWSSRAGLVYSLASEVL